MEVAYWWMQIVSGRWDWPVFPGFPVSTFVLGGNCSLYRVPECGWVVGLVVEVEVGVGDACTELHIYERKRERGTRKRKWKIAKESGNEGGRKRVPAVQGE